MRDDILKRLNISELSKMQLATSEAIEQGKGDVLVLSPTGTGKTLAYLLPLVEQLNAESDDLQAIVIVPGRELALQSAEVLASMKSGLRSAALYGGRPTMDEHRELMVLKPQIIFATPGRLNDHLDKQNISADRVEWVVIDEFDKSLEMGFQNEMQHALNYMPQHARHILLSATEKEEVPLFVNMHSVERLDFAGEGPSTEQRVVTYTLKSEDKDKLPQLARLLLSLGDESTMVFLNYRDAVERAAEYLRDCGFSVGYFHGGLDQNLRERALYMFANGSVNILVCTELASRGIDMPIVQNIVHYHLPETEQAYVHRAGRASRWEGRGRQFFLLGPEEALPSYADQQAEAYALPDTLSEPSHPKMATIYIGKGKKDKLSKGDIVGFLCKKGGLKGSEIGRININERYCYVAIPFNRMKTVLAKVAGEKIKNLRTVVELVH